MPIISRSVDIATRSDHALHGSGVGDDKKSGTFDAIRSN